MGTCKVCAHAPTCSCHGACLRGCSNNLTDLPEEIEEFRYLRILRLKYNQLKKLPVVVRSCVHPASPAHCRLSAAQLGTVKSTTMEAAGSGTSVQHVSSAIAGCIADAAIKREPNDAGT